ncbi:hypothetical protein Bca52824_032023 [Brassica carinata]|uniref:Uncharacterized protein n=1 Tax=Brassica carinata TaxID=52824 RepID=A0A8X7SC99_BRACI|nr:hypothetical protein Bca52824_032023 [Brassica carinata]
MSECRGFEKEAREGIFFLIRPRRRGDERVKDYVPTVFDNFSANVVVDGNNLNLGLWDTRLWIPELRHYAPGVPIILVGTKLDLQDDKQFFIDHPGGVPISTHQGEKLRKLIGSAVYIECSLKTQQNVKAVFDAAIKVVLQPPKQKKKKNKKPLRLLVIKEKSLKTTGGNTQGRRR